MLSTKTPPAGPQVKPLSETVAALLEDGVENVRNESAQALGVLMKIVGERAMNPILDPMDDLRKAKVKESFEKAVVKCKAGSAAPAPRAAAPAKAEPPKVSLLPTSLITKTELYSIEKRKGEGTRTGGRGRTTSQSSTEISSSCGGTSFDDCFVFFLY